MAKVTLRGHIRISLGDLDAVLDEMHHHIELTRAEQGCLVFEITRDPHDPCRFEVYEEFADQAAFDRHQARVRGSRWGEVSSNVARHYEITRTGDPGG